MDLDMGGWRLSFTKTMEVVRTVSMIIMGLWWDVEGYIRYILGNDECLASGLQK